MDYRARVVGPAALEGRSVLELRLEGTAKYNVTAETAIRFDSEGVPLLSFLLPFPKTEVRFARTLWFSSDTPYPVLVRDEVREGDRLHESLRYLSEFEAGARAIPWGPVSGVRDAVIWQRSPPARHTPQTEKPRSAIRCRGR